MRKQTPVIYCDFETSSDKINKRADVILWGALSDDMKLIYDISITSFFNFIDDIKQNTVIYFHNGSRFDFEFIKHYIGENLMFINDRLKLTPQSAWVMAKDKSTSYAIHYKNKKGFIIYFKCSYMFLKCALADLPNSSKIKKDDKFYEQMNTYKNKNEVDKEMLEYLFQDCSALKSAMSEYSKINNVKIPNYTSTGVAFKNFKKTIPDYKNKYENQINLEMHDKLNKWATGAMCLINSKYKQKLLNKVQTHDVNSLYPYTMTNSWMPYGQPIFKCQNDCKHNFTLIEIKLTGKLKKGYLPCVTTSNYFSSMVSIDWKSELNNDTCYMTKSMWKVISQYYLWEKAEIIQTICFESTFGIGHQFIEAQMEIKANAPNPSIERENAKINMNSCYGRFMMSPRVKRYEMKLINNKELKYNQTAYGKYYMEEFDDISDKIMYSPLGIAILSNAREYVIKHIQLNRENFVYCDTDSITITNGAKFIGIVHPSKLGMWKDEGTKITGYYIKLKMYVKANELGNLVETKGAGINSELTFGGKTITDVVEKNIVPMCKGMVKVSGGKYMETKRKDVKGWIEKPKKERATPLKSVN